MSEFERLLRVLMETTGKIGYIGASMDKPLKSVIRDIAHSPEADELLKAIMPKLIEAAKEEA